MTDDFITGEEFGAAAGLKIELVDGNLCIGGRSLGHGALARWVLGLTSRGDAAPVDAIADEILAWFAGGAHGNAAEQRTFLRTKLQQLVADLSPHDRREQQLRAPATQIDIALARPAEPDLRDEVERVRALIRENIAALDALLGEREKRRF